MSTCPYFPRFGTWFAPKFNQKVRQLMSVDEGVKKGVNALKEVASVVSPGEMFWAEDFFLL
jgi:hypothetical protein